MNEIKDSRLSEGSLDIGQIPVKIGLDQISVFIYCTKCPIIPVIS
jgi:hypothetical protein